MRYAGLDEAQSGIKIARRNINNLRCADDFTLMTESEEELKRLLMKVKEESEKVGFSSVTQLCLTLRPHELQHARPPCPSPTPSLLKLTSIEPVMPSNHLILYCPLLLLPSIFPSLRVFYLFIYLFSAQRFLFIHNIGSYLSQ